MLFLGLKTANFPGGSDMVTNPCVFSQLLVCMIVTELSPSSAACMSHGTLVGKSLHTCIYYDKCAYTCV